MGFLPAASSAARVEVQEVAGRVEAAGLVEVDLLVGDEALAWVDVFPPARMCAPPAGGNHAPPPAPGAGSPATAAG